MPPCRSLVLMCTYSMRVLHVPSGRPWPARPLGWWRWQVPELSGLRQCSSAGGLRWWLYLSPIRVRQLPRLQPRPPGGAPLLSGGPPHPPVPGWQWFPLQRLVAPSCCLGSPSQSFVLMSVGVASNRGNPQ